MSETFQEAKARIIAEHMAARYGPKPVVVIPRKPKPAKKPSTTCKHLGPELEERDTCKSCRGTVELKVYGCAVHFSCTMGRKVDGRGCCHNCPDRAPISDNPAEMVESHSEGTNADDEPISAGGQL